MELVFGIVVSYLEIAGNIESVGKIYTNRESAIDGLVKFIESEQEIVLSAEDIVTIKDYSQYITDNAEFAYSIVDFRTN